MVEDVVVKKFTFAISSSDEFVVQTVAQKSALQPLSCLHTLISTPRDPTVTTKVTKICKQISSPPQPYQKIPDIYLLRSRSLPNSISVLSLIAIQYVVVLFSSFPVIIHYCVILTFCVSRRRRKMYCGPRVCVCVCVCVCVSVCPRPYAHTTARTRM